MADQGVVHKALGLYGGDLLDELREMPTQARNQ
jgi:hypothetical protein